MPRISNAAAGIATPTSRDRHLLRFAGELWPRHIAEHNFLFAGMRGTGKTLSMKLLLSSALAGFTPGSGRRALVYDPKGDMPAFVDQVTQGWPERSAVKNLHPFHRDGYAYDFAAEFETASNPTSAAQNFAMTLIPGDSLGSEKHGRFWTSSAQEVVAGIVESFRAFAPGRWTLRDLVTVACDTRLIEPVLNRNSRGRRVTAKFGSTAETYGNVLQTVSSYLWLLEPSATAWEHHIDANRRITFSEWFTSTDVLLLNGCYEHPAATEPINALFLEFLRQRILVQDEVDWADPSHPETWMFLDEFAKIHPMPHLVDFFTQTRSKGGVQVLGLQEIDHLASKYTREIANTILGQFGYVGILKFKSPETARHFEQLVGSYEERVTLKSTHESTSSSPHGMSGFGMGSSTSGTGKSEQLMTRPGVLSQEFMLLDEVGAGATIDGWYVANGPYLRVTYSAERLGLRRTQADFPNFIPLAREHTEPRPWSPDDFSRMGVDTVPDGYLDASRKPPLSESELKTLVTRWKLPPYA